MKNIMSLFAVTLIVNSWVQAQTPIQRDDLIGTIGDISTQYNADYISEGSAGLDQTWDFSDLNVVGELDYEYVTVASTPAAALYPDAEYAQKITGAENIGDQYVYYKQEGNKEVQVGEEFFVFSIIHSDPQVVFNFPIVYGDSITDTFEASVTTFPEDGIRVGSTTFVVDGHGTLILPNGEFDNVYRIKLINDYTEEYPTTPDSDVLQTAYIFVKAGIKTILAWSQTFELNGIMAFNSGYADEAAVLGLEIISTIGDVTISPNPVSHIAYLSFQNEGSDIEAIEIYDLYGKKISDVELNYATSGYIGEYDFSSYAPGMYIIKISSEKSSVSKKIVVE